MADILNLSNLTGLTEGNAASQGSQLDTGDLRRKFGIEKVSRLSFNRDVWFYVMSQFRKVPQDDPEFKFVEVRTIMNRRYAYVIGFKAPTTGTWTTNDATFDYAVGAEVDLKMATDYKSDGNIPNMHGTASRSSNFQVGSPGTAPIFFIPKQTINIPVCGTAGGGGAPTGYYTAKVKAVEIASDKTYTKLTVEILSKPLDKELCSFSSNAPISDVYDKYIVNKNSKDGLASKWTMVIGNSHAPGSGYPETWRDNPYSTGVAYMQTFKNALGMDYETMATVLKHDQNEFLRLWGDKLIEHNMDIETALHFSHQGKDTATNERQLQGFVDYVLNYSPLFQINYSSTTSDDFLHMISNWADPRNVDQMGSVLWLADTVTYNWLSFLSGLMSNNLSINSGYRADIQKVDPIKLGRLTVTRLWTPYGTLNLVRDIYLDSSPVKLVGMDISQVDISPLVGNGIDRDTTVYPRVVDIDKGGVDARVDLVLTQLGQAIRAPERHIAFL